MAIKTFDTLKTLANHFGALVYRDTLDDSLLVQDAVNNVWHRYRWAKGRREIKFVETLMGSELPLMLQIYPELI